MSRIFITGSADGLGFMAAELLLAQRHELMLHARNAKRADDTQRALPGVSGIVVGDVASIAETRQLAEQANRL